MTKRKGGLGRGLETLLGAPAPPPPDASAPRTLPLAALQAGRYQPRTRMDEGALVALADSIRAQGVMQPVLVRPLDAERFEIIAGERRVRAAVLAGLDEIPVLVREVPDASAAVMALIENIQREDLNPLEEAQGIQRLIGEFRMTHEDAAAAIGRSRSATSNLLRLLNLARPVQAMLAAGDIDMGHARALLAVDGARQVTAAHEIVAKRLSVRDAERLVARATDGTDGARRTARRPSPDADVARLETELSDRLATKVEVRIRAGGRGQLVVDFDSLDQLDGVLAKIRGAA